MSLKFTFKIKLLPVLIYYHPYFTCRNYEVAKCNWCDHLLWAHFHWTPTSHANVWLSSTPLSQPFHRAAVNMQHVYTTTVCMSTQAKMEISHSKISGDLIQVSWNIS